MDKKNLRKKLLSQLNQLDQEGYKCKSTKIFNKLLENPVWREAQIIGITIARFPEVETKEIIYQAWQEGKIIAVPKCNPSLRTMDFRRINSFSQLESSFYGLREPIEAETAMIPKENIDLIIVPGLIYNREGYRIGFGGGYYDRYLQNFKKRKVSLAFSEQIREGLPVEGHDIPVEKIFTDDEVISVVK